MGSLGRTARPVALIRTPLPRCPSAPVATPPPVFTAPELPTAEEVTEATFAFAQKLLKQQKTFAEKLLAASTLAAK